MLTLLVSFVTSIATGIVTVSLMDQAPQGITQTINRIVERTVEKVVTEPIRSTAAAVSNAVTTAQPQEPVATQTTVVVKEDDLAADSIARVQHSMVRLVAEGSPDSAAFARGVIVTVEGAIIVDRATTDPNLKAEVILNSGRRLPVKPREPLPDETLRFYDIDSTGTTTPNLQAVSLADVSKLRLGQGVIRIGGRAQDSVTTGVISTLPTIDDKGSSGLIESTASASLPGSVLITIFGDLVGITTTDSLLTSVNVYTPASTIAAGQSADRTKK